MGNGGRRRRRGRIVAVEKPAQKRERGRALGAGRVRVVRHEHAEALRRDERQVGVKPACAAAVADDAQPVARLLVKPEREARDLRVMTERARVHPGGGGVAQDPPGAGGAVPEMREHERRHVGGGGAHCPCGPRAHEELPVLRVESSSRIPVALRHVSPEAGRQRLASRCPRHAERLEDAPLEVLVPRQPRGALDDVAGESQGVVGVGAVHPGRAHADGHVRGEPAADRHQLRGIPGPEVAAVVLESRRVGEEVRKRDRLRVRGRNLEVQVLVHVGVEVEPPRLDQLHDGGGREELGDRPDAE